MGVDNRTGADGGNHCKRCEVYCFDEDYCEACKEHIMSCNECGEDIDKSNLASVLTHEHGGFPLDDVMGKRGEPK